MTIIKSPHPFKEIQAKKTIFLAGSIEMGEAEEWQEEAIKLLDAEDVLLLSPRREQWDSTWTQAVDNENFRQQVEWELDAAQYTDYVLMYFDIDTKSPITLLELGMLCNSGKIFVVCPEGYWRKGNVDIICQKFNIPTFGSLEEACKYVASLS